MKGKDTKAQILDAAIELFNESGTAAVSTNHIAQAVGISPGNLYYHYRNKEEIIREVLKKMFIDWGELWVVPQERSPDFEDLRAMLRENFSLLWRYRFFYRETIALMQRDPELARQHQSIQGERLAEQELFLKNFVEAGVMCQPERPETLPALVKAGWILGTNWLEFLEAGGHPVEPEQMEQGVEVIFEVIRPHLTEGALAELENSTSSDNFTIDNSAIGNIGNERRL